MGSRPIRSCAGKEFARVSGPEDDQLVSSTCRRDVEEGFLSFEHLGLESRPALGVSGALPQEVVESLRNNPIIRQRYDVIDVLSVQTFHRCETLGP